MAKNGDLEHKVYKREAEAEADADAQVFYNTYGYWPTGYTGLKTVSPIVKAAPAVSYTRTVPTTTYAAGIPTTYAGVPTTYSAPLAYTHGAYPAPYAGQYFL